MTNLQLSDKVKKSLNELTPEDYLEFLMLWHFEPEDKK